MAEAKDFWVRINMHSLEILNHKLEMLFSDPVSPQEGIIWYNSTSHEPKVRTLRGTTSANRFLIADDDDFHNRVNLVSTIQDTDEVLIWDSSATDIDHQQKYRRITKATLVTGLSTLVNAYSVVRADSGTVVLNSSGASSLAILGDSSIIRTVGSIVGMNTVTLEFRTQSANYVFAGPPSGVSAIPTFRRLLDTDLPSSYTPSDWDDAYSHASQTTGNPHNVVFSDLGYDIATVIGTPGDNFTLATEKAVRDALTASAPLFTSDISVILSGGKSLGKYTNGQTISATGKTIQEVIIDIALEYINSSFTSFSISGQATTVEVGTTLSGSKTFTWGINAGSGSVSTIDIYDITAFAVLVNDTANDGTQAATITSIQLNADGSTQQWRGIGTDVTPTPDVDFNSGTFTVTSRFYRFFGPASASVTDSASVRALSSSAFHADGTFILNSGITLTKFIVCLPPGKTITSVFDLDALNADITSQYVAQSNINVLDAGSTNRSYNIYEMNIGSAYSSSHRHSITTA